MSASAVVIDPNMDSISTAAQHLYNNIIAMAGTKIVTIAADEHVQSFDLHGSEIGYHPSHKRKFVKLLNDAVKRGGGVIIRQFTDVRIRCETPNGIMDLPIKNVCGVMCLPRPTLRLVRKKCAVPQKLMPAPAQRFHRSPR